MENTDIQPPQTCHLPEDSKQPDGVQLDNLDAAGRAKRDVNTTISTPKSWWKQHVAQEVPLEACRDYYGTLISSFQQIGLKTDIPLPPQRWSAPISPGYELL